MPHPVIKLVIVASLGNQLPTIGIENIPTLTNLDVVNHFLPGRINDLIDIP